MPLWLLFIAAPHESLTVGWPRGLGQVTLFGCLSLMVVVSLETDNK